MFSWFRSRRGQSWPSDATTTARRSAPRATGATPASRPGPTRSALAPRREAEPGESSAPTARVTGAPREAGLGPRVLGDSEITQICNLGQVRRLAPGALLPWAESTAAGLMLVVEGSIVVSARGEAASLGGASPPDGASPLGGAPVLAVLGKGACWGRLEESHVDLPWAKLAAGDASVVLELDSTAALRLPPHLQLALYDRAMRANEAVARGWSASCARLDRQRNAVLERLAEHERRTSGALVRCALADALADVPRLPVYATSLTAKLLDDRTNVSEVIASIKDDPALASLVLKSINSPYYGLSQKISSYYQAFLLLGASNVYHLVLGSAVESTLAGGPDARAIQQHSQLVALLAHELALLTKKGQPQVMSTIGLLHEIGKVAAPLLCAKDAAIATIVELAGFARVGALLLEGWEIPQPVPEVIEHQSYPELAPPERIPSQHREEIALLHVAHLVHDRLTGAEAPGGESPFAREYLALLGIAADSVAELYATILLPALARRASQMPERVRRALREAAASGASES